MTPSPKRLTLAALTLATTGTAITPLAAHAAIPVYGGLGITYEGGVPTGNGYILASALNRQSSYTGSATGASSVTRLINGGSSGSSFIQRATPSGAVELGSFNATLENNNNLSYVAGANALGDIVGTSRRQDAAGNIFGYRAAKWAAGQTTPIELLPISTANNGTATGVAYAINTSGAAVGFSTQYTGDSPTADLPVKWNAAGTPTLLPTPGYTPTGFAPAIPFAFSSNGAVAINDAGSTVGTIAASSNGTRSFIWDAANNPTELQSLGATGTSTNNTVRTLNPTGTSAGLSRNAANQTRAVTWSPTGNVTLLAGPAGAFAGYTSEARDINAAGAVIGTSTYISASDTRAVYWAPNGAATLLASLSFNPVGTNAGTTSDTPIAINDTGIIVGNARLYTNPSTSAFTSQAVAWRTDGAIINLNSLIDSTSGWTLNSVLGISEDNWITGLGSFDPDGAGPLAAYTRLYLLQLPPSALPEPSALTALLPTTALLRRRR